MYTRRIPHRRTALRDSRLAMTALLPGPYGVAVSKMERSFLTTALVPTLVFLTGYGTVLVAAVWSFGGAAAWWSGRSAAEQLTLALIVAAAVWFLAGLFASNWRKIVRFYEGYPLAALLPTFDATDVSRRRRLSAVRKCPGTAWHLRRYANLTKGKVRGGQPRLYSRYVPDAYKPEILPTTIGNILLSAERYGLDRYGLDSTVLWPRLYWCLPDPVQVALDRFKEDHQLPLALSFISAIFTVFSGVTVFLAGGPWNLFLAVCLAGTALAVLAYLLAVERTEEYAEQVRAVVDMYHQELEDKWIRPYRDNDEVNHYAAARHFVLHGTELVGDGSIAGADRPQGGRVTKALGFRGKNCIAIALGRALLTAGRRLSAGSEDDQATLGPPPVPGSQDSEAGVALTPHHQSLASRSWEWAIARVRLSAGVVGLLLCLTAAGSILLYQRHTNVLVAVSSTSLGQPVKTRIESRATRTLPTGVITAGHSAKRFFATSNIAEGALLRSDHVSPEGSLAQVTLPLTPGTVPLRSPMGLQVRILLAPCGNVVERVLVTGWAPGTSTATILVPGEELSDLKKCRADSVTLLLPPT